MCCVPDVWGFDEEHVEVLKGMKPQDTEMLVQRYAILLDINSELLPENAARNTSVSLPCEEGRGQGRGSWGSGSRGGGCPLKVQDRPIPLPKSRYHSAYQHINISPSQVKITLFLEIMLDFKKKSFLASRYLHECL